MKQFEYTIQDPLGIHARPAGQLVKLSQQFSSACTIIKEDKVQRLTKLIMLMSMGIKQGDTVTIQAVGPDEDTAVQALKAFFEENL